MSRFTELFCFGILGIISTTAAASEDLLEVGESALRGNKFHFAIACANDVLEKDPTSTRAYFLRGRAYAGRHKWANAIKDFSKVIQFDPKYPEVHMNRGNAYVRVKEYEKAMRD